MSDPFSEKAATWDAQPHHADRARAVAALIRETVDLAPGSRTLEIGGGTGLLSRALADDLGPVVVTDVAPGMVAAATQALQEERYAGWRAERFDIEHDPLPAERFDLILGLLTLHHMGDIAAVIRRCAELLNPGGQLVIVDLDHDPAGDFHSGHEHEGHHFEGHDGFTRESVRGWFGAAGLVDVRVGDGGGITKEVHGEERDFSMFIAIGCRV